jgi:hypothetical protein
MTSARNYWTDAQLIDDARRSRAEETELLLRARTEHDKFVTLRAANAAAMRAEASETFLRNRRLVEEQKLRLAANNR